MSQSEFFGGLNQAPNTSKHISRNKELQWRLLEKQLTTIFFFSKNKNIFEKNGGTIKKKL